MLSREVLEDIIDKNGVKGRFFNALCDDDSKLVECNKLLISLLNHYENKSPEGKQPFSILSNIRTSRIGCNNIDAIILNAKQLGLDYKNYIPELSGTENPLGLPAKVYDDIKEVNIVKFYFIHFIDEANRQKYLAKELSEHYSSFRVSGL